MGASGHRFHDLRHSCGTLLDEQGVQIENIQDVLGHSSPTITETLYVEFTDKVRRDAVDQLGLLFDERGVEVNRRGRGDGQT